MNMWQRGLRVGLHTVMIVSLAVSVAGYAAAPARAFPVAQAEEPPSLEIPADVSVETTAAEAASAPFLFHPVRLKSRTFTPDAQDVDALQRLSRSDGGRVHVLLQLDFIPRRAAKKALEAQGVKLLAYVPDYTWIASIPAAEPRAVLRLPGVVWAGPLAVDDKLAPAIRADRWDTFNLSADGTTVAVYVSFHMDENLEAGHKIVEAHGGKVIHQVVGINTLVVEMPRANLRALAAEDAVQWIEPVGPPLTANNDGIRAQIGVDEVQASPYNLDGTEVDVLVYDVGQVGDHPDFGSRLTHGDSTSVADHATHVAGTVGGDGTQSASAGGSANQWRGMAPAADIISYGFEWDGTGMWFYDNPGDIEQDWAQAQNSYGADIGTASIGSNISFYFPSSCDLLGNYGVTARLIDQIVRGGNSVVGIGDKYIATWSVGNERGGSYCATSPSGYRKIAPPAAAKNPIHVGASNTDDDSMTSFSSWGPTDDGRIKPIVVAGGDQVGGDGGIHSTVPDLFIDNSSYLDCDGTGDDYCYPYDTMSGTSMATPAVAGGIALMLQQYWKVYHTSSLFWPSTAKAILMQTATDMGNLGPDYQWGYGQVDIQAAVDLITRKAFLEDSVDDDEVDVFYFVVPNDDDPVTVSLAWDDYEATVNASPTLINDLDLELVAPDGTVWRPWVLDPNDPTADAARGIDSLNNQEQVQVFPTEENLIGTWIVRVKGTTVPQGPQDYSLACEGCQPLDLGVCQSQVDGTTLKAIQTTGPEMAMPTEEAQPLTAGEIWQRKLEAAIQAGEEKTQAQEIEEAIALVEAAQERGPEAVVASIQTLTGSARDILDGELERAEREMHESAPPPPQTFPISEAEERATVEADIATAAVNRSQALMRRTDPAENSGAGIPVRPVNVPHRSAADLTVGQGCTYASISEALATANTGDRILIEGGVIFTENLTIDISVTLQGGYSGCASGSTARTTVNGSGSASVIIIAGGISVTLRNLNVTNGATSAEGGGIRFAPGTAADNSHLTLDGVEIYDNQGGWGGGLWVGPNAEVVGNNVNIYNNTATAKGGGVRLYGSRAIFHSSNIYDNSSPLGGGVYASKEEGYAPSLDLPIATDIYDNQALSGDGLGGGLYLEEGAVAIAECSDLYSNDAINGGGAYLVTSTLEIEGFCSEIEYNDAFGNGGGLYAQGSTIYLEDMVDLRGNSAGGGGTGHGGGAYLDNSNLYSRKSKITSNLARGHGGGIYAINASYVGLSLGSYSCLNAGCSAVTYNTADNYGGGLYLNGSHADLYHTYVRGNSAKYGGGAYLYSSTLAVYSTFFVHNDSTSGVGDGVRLFNSSSLSGSGITWAYNDYGGASTGRAIDLSSSDLSISCSVIWGHTSSINSSSENVTYTDVQGGYAGTGNLDTNPLFVGGDDYHLQSSSPLIDRCVSGPASLDIDGEARPIIRATGASPYDMGADEVSGEARVGLNGNPCAYTTIQQAVNAAEDGDTLYVAEGVYFENVEIKDKDLTIVGGYDALCTSSAGSNASSHVNGSLDQYATTFYILNSTVTLRDMEITWGRSYYGGGLSLWASQVELDNVDLHNNYGYYGGGLYINATSVLTATGGSSIASNTARASNGGGGARVWGKLVGDDLNLSANCAPNGGGLYIPGGAVYLENGSSIYQNQAADASGVGGGVRITAGGLFSSTGTLFLSNSAYHGGGIHADSATLYLSDDTFGWNDADKYGGGIYLTGNSTLHARDLVVGYATFYWITLYYQNTAYNGGGIYAENSSLEINDSRFSLNQADFGGGGLYLDNSTLQMTGTTIGLWGNTPGNHIVGSGRGAGMYLGNGSRAVLSDTTVISNTIDSSASGGGIYVGSGSVVTLTNSVVRDHTLVAPNGLGAGIYAYNGSTVILDHSQVLSNTASAYGGGIRSYNSTVNVTHDSTIMHNHTDSHGGGIAAYKGVVNISDSTLQHNTASGQGGAVYLDSSDANFTGWWDLRWNSAGSNGGAVAAVGATDVDFVASDPSRTSYLSVNAANGGDGGSLYVNSTITPMVALYATYGSPLSINSNTALTNGGAIAIEAPANIYLLGDVQMTSNSAGESGGVVYLDNNANLFLANVLEYKPEILVNTAQKGGAIYAINGARVYGAGVTIGTSANGNQATSGDGGSIHLREGTLELYDSIVRNGQATNYGGGLYVYSSTVRLLRVKIYGNQAKRGGGLYQAGSGTVSQIQNTLIYSNHVSEAYGAGIRAEGGTITLTHVTLANNIGGAGLSLSSTTCGLHNSIAWGNERGGVWDLGSPVVTQTCNIDQSENAGVSTDPRFISPGGGEDYHLRGDSPAIDRCSNGVSPDLDSIQRPVGEGYDAGAYEYPYAIEFAPDNSGSGPPLSTIAYTHTLTNAGGTADTYTLSVRSALGWPVTLVPTPTLALGEGETGTVVAHLTVPAHTLSGTVDLITITATSASDPYLTANVIDTTTVTFAADAALAPKHTTLNAMPGTVYAYTHVLTNTGNYTDRFVLSAHSTRGWGILLDSGPFVLGPGLTATVRVSVTVPVDGSGLSDNTTITATSDGGATATVLDITSAFLPGLAIAPDRSQTVAHNTAVTYTHTLTNTGNSTDTFHLTFTSSQGWGTLVDSGPFILPGGGSVTVRARIAVPAGAAGLRDFSIITATSTGGAGPSVITDTTTVYTAALTLGPSYTKDVPAGDIVTYTHYLTNTGATTDTFDVGLASSQGWAMLVDSGPFTLGAGQAVNLRVQVNLPAGTGGMQEITILTATSRAGQLSGIAAVVTDTTTAVRSYGATLTPNYNRSALPGTVLTYTHHLTNTGNATDTFALALHSTQSWAVLLNHSPITLAAGAGITLRVAVTVPAGSGGQVDIATLVATSQLSPTASATATDTTTSIYSPGLVLTPSITFNASAGSVVIYTHFLTNTGNGPDQFNLTFNSQRGWSTLLDPGPFDLKAGQGVTVQIQVNVPAGSGGLAETATLTATAQEGSTSSSVTDTTTVPHLAGADVWPEYIASVPPGQVQYFTHHLKNTGNGPDTYTVTLTSSQGWASLETASPIALGYGETAQIVVAVHVPDGIISGTQTNVATVTVTSQADPAVQDTAHNTTTVGFAPGVGLAPDRVTTGATPGNTYLYTHTLTNLGNYTDTLVLTYTSNAGWGSLLTTGPFTLGPGSATVITVQVNVPGSGTGQADQTVITATSQGGGGPAVVRDTTAAFTPGVALAPDGRRTINTGQAVTYTHTLTNTGTASDLFVVRMADERGWATLLDAGPFALAAGATATIRVRVTAPPGSGGLSNRTVLTATALNGAGPSDAVVDETHVSHTAGVVITPDYTRTVLPGSAIIYTHRLTNTGNGADTISLALYSQRGWATLLDSGPFTLTAGAATDVRVQVSVPTETHVLVRDVTVLTATASGGVSDTATDTTIAGCVPPSGASITLAPPSPEAGQAVVFTGTVTVGSMPLTYTWNFGDGSPEQRGDTIAHIFSQAGHYTVMMTVTNPCGGPVTTTRPVAVTAPTFGVALGPDHTQTVAAGTTVTYLHTLRNIGTAVNTYTLSLHSTRGWSTLLDTSPITLAAEATATVRVRTTVPAGASVLSTDVTIITATGTAGNVSDTATDRTTVACNALAGLAIEGVTTATTGQVIPFTATVTAGSQPITYVWNFGDGSPERTDNPTAHTFVQAGSFTVVVTATNPCSVRNATHTITVTGPTLVPDVTVSPATLEVSLQTGQTVTRTLMIQNTGSGALSWSLTEVPAVTWLTVTPTGGNIPPAGSVAAAVAFDATGVITGTYTTTLRLASNDPDENPVTIPVTLTVTAQPLSWQLYLPLVMRDH